MRIEIFRLNRPTHQAQGDLILESWENRPLGKRAGDTLAKTVCGQIAALTSSLADV